MKRFTVVLVLVVLCFIGGNARAGYQTIDLSGVVNGRFDGSFGNGDSVVNGATFPTGSQTFGNVPFNIPSGQNQNNMWLGWLSYQSETRTFTDPTDPARQFTATTYTPPSHVEIPVSVYGVREVYTLINTMWGMSGGPYASIEFIGSNGASYLVSLYGNDTIRDYNNYNYTNLINGTTTIQVWENGQGQRLDTEVFNLPSSFYSQYLQSIRITDSGGYGGLSFNSDGTPFFPTEAQSVLLSGITVQTVPIPGAAWLLGSGLTGVIGAKRRLKRRFRLEE